VKNGLPIEEVEEVEDAAGRGEAGARSGTGEEVNNELDREMIYIAIVTSDSTVVYYKLSKGIKKPADIPDE